MEWSRQHLTYANVMVTILAFIVLGGGAYAVATAKKNSVTSKSVKNESLKGTDVRDDSLTGLDVNEGTLALPAGPKGEKGDKGDTGAHGLPGAAAAAATGPGTPAASPDMLLTPTTTLSAPTSGRVLVLYSTVFMNGQNCDAGNADFGLYVDGVAVPGTKFGNLSPSDTGPFSLFGVTAAALPAGDHIIQPGLDCPDGNVSAVPTMGDPRVGGILVGGS